MNEQELFDELCAEVGPGVSADMAFDSEAVGSPFVITVFSSIIIKMLRKQTCKQKEAIIAAATKYINENIKNRMIANMMIGVLDTAVAALCPSDTNVVG